MGFFSSIFGGGDKKPATQQTIQTSKLAPEIAPFAEEILTDAQKLYLAQMKKGYTPYTGESIAPMTPEQLQSQEGLKALIGIQRPLQDEALAQFRTGVTEKFTPEMAQEYMSPYQRAVTDIEKRESQRAFESQTMPAFEKLAVGAGGMSGLGTRAGVQAAELGRAQMQRLGDIETKGLQSAYKDAQNLFTQQQARERTAALDIARLAPQITAGGLSEQGLLQTIGEDKQALGQQALNEAYFKYLEEQDYASDKLAEYSGFVYGNPLMSNRSSITTSPAPSGPSTGSQLMGLGLTAAKMYGQGGGWGNDPSGFSMGNLFSMNRAEGGGLSSLPVVYRQNGGGPRRPDLRSMIELDEGEATDLLALSEEAALPAAPAPAPSLDPVEELIRQSMDRLRRKDQLSPEDYTKKLTEDRDRLRELYSARKGERKTSRKAYEDSVKEARKRTFEAQQDLGPTGHPGYERAMKVLLRETPAGREEPGLLEQVVRAGSAYSGGLAEGAEAKRKERLELEKRRGTEEMGDIKDYERMRVSDEAEAYTSELDMVKNINPSLWKAAQKREAALRKEGLTEAHIRAQMRHYLGQEKLNQAKALKEQGIGAKIKPAVFNAIRATFTDMVDGGMFTGVRTPDGGFIITGISGKGQIKPHHTAEINKILADALAMGDIAKAAKFIQDRLAKFGQVGVPPKSKKRVYKKGDRIEVTMKDGTKKWVENTGEKGDKEWKDLYDE